VGVEKGTKAVISMNFSFYGGRTFNNVRADFSQTNDQKEFFNSHRRLQKLAPFVRLFVGQCIMKERPASQD
jgi:hypothetical protein